MPIIKTQAEKRRRDRKVEPSGAAVKDVMVYTNEEPKATPFYYWLLPTVLCVVVNGASVYVNFGEES